MSSWQDKLMNDNLSDVERLSRESALMHHCPDLWDFFCGSYDEKGECLIPAGSIQIWMEDGRLKTCWKIKAKGLYGFVVLSDQADLSKCLQQCLTTGAIEWRKDGGKKRA